MKKFVVIFIFLSSLTHAEESEQQVLTIEKTVRASRPQLLEGSLGERVISEHQFSLMKPQNLQDIFKMGSEFSVSDPPGGIVGVFLHGADSEKLMVIIDGMVMNDPTAPGGGFDFRFLQPSEIAEIRIWSPSESIVWGPGGIGGILFIKTKRRAQKTLAGSLACNKTYQLHTGIGVESGAWNHFVSGSFYQTEGISSLAPATGELDGAQKFNFRVASSRISEKNDFLVQMIHSQGHQKTDSSTDDPNAGSNFQNWSFYLQNIYRPQSNIEMMGSFGLRKLGRNEFNDPDTLSAAYDYGKESANEESLRFQFLRLVGRHSLDTGFDWHRIVANFDSQSSSAASQSFVQSEAKAGGYLRFHYLWGQSTVVPGFRFQQSDSGVNLISSLRFLRGFGESLRFEAQLTSSVKDPSLYQKYSSLYGNRLLKAEVADVLQVGVIKENPGQKLSFLHFQQWYRNLIQYNTSQTKYLNEASAHIYGYQIIFEKNLRQVILKGSWMESFAYNGAGEFLLRRPRQQLTLASEHIIKKFRFTPQILWKGQREDSTGTARVYLPSYLSLDLGWMYFFREQMSLEGAFRNILGQDMTEAYNYSAFGRRAELGFRANW